MHNKYIVRIIKICLTVFFCIHVFDARAGVVTNYPVPKDCIDAINWEQYNGFCRTGLPDFVATGINLLVHETSATGFQGSGFAMLSAYYVPYAGSWSFRMYLCPMSSAGTCLISKATSFIESTKSVMLNSSAAITDQGGDWGGSSGNIPANTSICYAMIDTSYPSKVWQVEDARFCKDGMLLPSNPADCYINGSMDLNVDLGSIERSAMTTDPRIKSGEIVKKSIDVLCTRDSSTSLSMQFQYTPISISGSQMIDTKLSGVGVAILYNGKVVNPSDTFQRNFPSGYSTLELGFVAVRDASTSIENVATGSFNANATLVMTEL